MGCQEKITMVFKKTAIFLLFINMFLFTEKLYAKEVNQCAAENITLQIYRGSSSRIGKKIRTDEPSLYDKFTAELSQHISKKLANELACQQGRIEPVEMSLVFVQQHLTPDPDPALNEYKHHQLEKKYNNLGSCQ